MIRIAALMTAAVLLTGASVAGTDVKLPPFTAIAVHGGGEVKLSYGPVQRVTVIKGDTKVAQILVKGQTLDLSPCTGVCWGSHDLVVEVVLAKLDAVDIHGGGNVTAQGTFPTQPHLNAEVHGGGEADLRAIPFDSVNAEVHGGGSLRVKALNTLNAQVHGGGDVSYVGHPAHIVSQTHGGGSINGE
ncbi:MAG: DUF2807 domain-containing protein [Rhizomicrobium sp.]|nr:DUF2807 domain-containing protein [Rhizomicrobium sp.]